MEITENLNSKVLYKVSTEDYIKRPSKEVLPLMDDKIKLNILHFYRNLADLSENSFIKLPKEIEEFPQLQILETENSFLLVTRFLTDIESITLFTGLIDKLNKMSIKEALYYSAKNKPKGMGGGKIYPQASCFMLSVLRYDSKNLLQYDIENFSETYKYLTVIITLSKSDLNEIK